MPTTYPSLAFIRSFTTTLSRLARPSDSNLKHRHRPVPSYPYGPSTTYKQSNFGLYGGSSIRFGNQVSERNEIKTRRKWKPNIHEKRLWSDAMGKFLRVRVQARVLRTIDKVGGLDEYLLGNKAGRIKELGMEGWLLRWKIMQTEAVQERFRQEKMAMGLEVPSEEEVAKEKEDRVTRKAEKLKAFATERARKERVIRDRRQARAQESNAIKEREKVVARTQESV